MPNQNSNMTRNQLRLIRLRAELKAGLDALERGDFIEIDEADLETYLEGLAATATKRGRGR
jgi:antitoxin ParD1/3/4